MEVRQLDTRVQKDEDTRKENYRPVSVLTALSKVYEKVMYDQLYNTFCRLRRFPFRNIFFVLEILTYLCYANE